MVAVARMDRRLTARLDPSDVVQEALADGVRDLPDYLTTRPMAFYPWLRNGLGPLAAVAPSSPRNRAAKRRP